MELMTIIIIIGVLASLSLPRLFHTVERMRAEEGRKILLDLLAAQKRFFLENNGYANNINQLDVSFDLTSSNFNNFSVNSANPIARVQRNNGSYNLRISDQGVITCTGDANLCATLQAGLN